MSVSGRYGKTRVAAGIVGTERCMFEPNFLVDRVSTGYNILWNAFKKLTASYSPQERAQLFHDNAARLYRLP